LSDQGKGYGGALLTLERMPLEAAAPLSSQPLSGGTEMDAQDYPIRHFQEMDRLATTLKDLPAQVLDHAYFYEAFGSWSMTIRYKGCLLRLTFDGSPYAWSSVWNRTDLSEDAATPAIIDAIQGAGMPG
jgi:hypothetical protein